jgi:transcriptional regulator with XRE-family HTH domain
MFNGVELRTLREQRGLTKGAVSERTGLSRSTLARLERGLSVPSIETLLKLANSMELPLPRLLSKVGILNRKTGS